MYYKSIVTTPIIASIVKILVKRQCRKRLPAILEWVNEITTYYKEVVASFYVVQNSLRFINV